MVWDCLIAWVVILFTLVGSSQGFVRSLTVPPAMVIATVIAQLIYIDLATVLSETLHLETSFSVFFAYLFSWFWLVQYLDAFLAHLFHARTSEYSPGVPSKIAGGMLGFTKGFGAFVLAAMVTYAQNKVPEPPEICWQNRWMVHAAVDSRLLPQIHLVASRLDQPIGKFVLSKAAPRFRPNFALGDDPFAAIEKRQEKKGEAMVKGYKQLKKDLDPDP